MQLAPRRTWLAAQLIAATFLAIPIHAQSSATASLAITAQIVSPLSIVTSHALEFGRLALATNRTVAPNSSAAGHFELHGEGGSAVTVTLSMPVSLNPSSSGPSLPLTGWTYILSDSPALTGTPVSFSSGTSAPISVTFAASADARIYFGIGATAQSLATQPIGTYTGVGQISAAYVDL